MNTEHIDVEHDFSDAQLAEMFLHHRVLIVPVATAGRVHAVVTRSDYFRELVSKFASRPVPDLRLRGVAMFAPSSGSEAAGPGPPGTTRCASMPLRPGSSSQPETATVRLSIACLGAYVILDAVACLEPGVSVGDHSSALIAPVAVLGGFAWAYPGMRAGLRVLACLSLASLATVAAGVSVAHATTEGLDAVDLAGFLLFAVAGALLAVGVLVGWQTRRADGHRYIRRTLIGVAGLVFAFEVLVPIGLAWIGTHRPAEPPGPVRIAAVPTQRSPCPLPTDSTSPPCTCHRRTEPP